MTTSESSKAGEQGSGARAITRGEEARVRAALPQCPALDWYADGRLRGIAGEHHAACLHPSVRATAARAGIVPGPEGWCWAAPLATVAAGDLFRSHRTGNVRRADALETRGLPRPVWRMVKVGDELNVVWESPEDLADPSQWERLGAEGVEGQDKGAAPEESEPAPSTPSPQPEGRPARLRAALLAVLAPGPVTTRGMLLPIVEGEMGAEAGSVEPAEVRRAAAEIGARVDGVEWSLPAVPDGWGWRLDNELGISFLLRESVPTSDINTLVDQAIARADEDTGEWMIWLPGADAWTTGGNMLPIEAAQAAALQAARLAGLFAAPRAEAAPVATPAPTAPLDALARILTGEAAPTFEQARAALDVWALANEERAVRRLYDAAKREDSEAAGDPLLRAALAVSAARRALRAAGPGSGEWSAAEIEVARATGALLDALGVDAEEVAGDARHAQRIAENERDAALALHRDQSHKAANAERALGFARMDLDVACEVIKRVEGERDAALARAGLDAADRATLDAVGRLREALTALCAGPGAWRWPVDESAPDAAVRLIGVMASRIADFETVQRVADAHRQEMRASRDAALATVERVRERLEPVLAAIAGGRPVAPLASSPSCSFCGKSSEETRIFVAGIGADPAVICDECAVLSAQIVEGGREGETVAIAGGREVGK